MTTLLIVLCCVFLVIIAVLAINLNRLRKRSDGQVIDGLSQMFIEAMQQKEREMSLRIKSIDLCVNGTRSIENVIRDSKVIYDYISGENLEKKSDEDQPVLSDLEKTQAK